MTHANGRSRNVPVNEKGQERQHWLLSAGAVTLTEAKIARMTDDEAYAALEAITFAADDGVPHCLFADCGAPNAYTLTVMRRQKWGVVKVKQYKCRECRRRFTLTSQCKLAYRKLPIRDILYGLIVFTNAASGEAALRWRRAVGCSYKAAFVNLHKFREALAETRPKRKLEGVVEVDGTNIGGHHNKARLKKRGAEQPTGTPSAKRSLMVIRERSPEGISRVGLFEHELAYRTGPVGPDFIRDNVVRGSTMVSDEGFELGYIGPTETVKHKEGFKVGDAHNNGAEGYFSRFKRAKRGVHYGFGSPSPEHDRRGLRAAVCRGNLLARGLSSQAERRAVHDDDGGSVEGASFASHEGLLDPLAHAGGGRCFAAQAQAAQREQPPEAHSSGDVMICHFIGRLTNGPHRSHPGLPPQQRGEGGAYRQIICLGQGESVWPTRARLDDLPDADGLLCVPEYIVCT